jgi:hypothetical protein
MNGSRTYAVVVALVISRPSLSAYLQVSSYNQRLKSVRNEVDATTNRLVCEKQHGFVVNSVTDMDGAPEHLTCFDRHEEMKVVIRLSFVGSRGYCDLRHFLLSTVVGL